MNDYKLYDTNDKGNGVNIHNEEMSSLYNSFGNPANQMLTQTPWTIQPNVPNLLTGYYIGNGKNFSLQIKVIDPNIPEYCKCLGKASDDNNIRIYSESECAQLPNSKYDVGTKQCLKTTNGSHSWDCRGLNTQIPCLNDWGFIPGSMLYLTQDPYAPMISFNVVKDFASYNCDYHFMDKRLSSHKMKWAVYQGSGPTPAYAPNDDDTPTFPLGMSYTRFASGSGLYSPFLIKMYSFVTLVYIVRFNKVPAAGMQSDLCWKFSKSY